MSSKRKIATYVGTLANGEKRAAIVYWDAQWGDCIVEYYKNDKHMKDASSHHYDDKEDAHSTAKSYVAGNW